MLDEGFLQPVGHRDRARVPVLRISALSTVRTPRRKSSAAHRSVSASALMRSPASVPQRAIVRSGSSAASRSFASSSHSRKRIRPSTLLVALHPLDRVRALVERRLLLAAPVVERRQRRKPPIRGDHTAAVLHAALLAGLELTLRDLAEALPVEMLPEHAETLLVEAERVRPAVDADPIEEELRRFLEGDVLRLLPDAGLASENRATFHAGDLTGDRLRDVLP